MLYVKRLTPQELGYRNGSLKTGGYFYISKKAAKYFFGLLSKDIVNDFKVIKLYRSNIETDFAEATYVFHNDKHALAYGTRDEYRIYLNRQLQFHDMHFRPQDIIVFCSNPRQFMLHHYKQQDEKYHFWDNLLLEMGTKGNHAITEEL